MRVLLLAALLAAALPATGSAHHSIAGVYDTAKRVKLKGRLTELEIVNPHSRFAIEADGAVWSVESSGVAGMERRGFDRSAFKVGDRVTVEGAPARDGSKALWLNKLSKGGASFESRR